uniref:B3 domain-containing protein At3g18960 family n=1 Tax=Cajanus cajan TaxID=3821 RepID=A0A151QXG3_CAJCA|nr:B3 domain-containing protein At3g18960 family [Cajanus cajan]
MLIENSLQKIPNRFTREYGGNLSNAVFLKPPDGIKWGIYWTKHDADIWFQKGWKEFATYYSLSHGHVLFKYQETCHLKVHIFDRSSLEVSYPFCGTQIEHDNLDYVSNDSVEVLDNSVNVLDEVAPSQKTELKSTIPCPQPLKN